MKSQHGYGFVYALGSVDGRIRYIGQTKGDTELRLRRHIADARRRKRPTPVLEWIRSQDYKVAVSTIQGVAFSDINDAERHWIETFTTAGECLMNVQTGGRGAFAVADRIAVKMRGRKRSAAGCANIAAAWTPERRAAQAQRNRLRFQDQAARDHMAAKTRARFADPAERAKVSAVNRRRFEDPAARARISLLARTLPRNGRLWVSPS